MAEGTFKISLRLRHPSMDPREMAKAIGMAPRFQWRVGDRRIAPAGTFLEDHRDHNYCCLRFAEDQRLSLSRALDKHAKSLRNCKQFLDEFHASGGSAEFFIGWFVDKNSGDVLEWSLLRELAELHISLSFDIYGGEVPSRPEL